MLKIRFSKRKKLIQVLADLYVKNTKYTRVYFDDYLKIIDYKKDKKINKKSKDNLVFVNPERDFNPKKQIDVAIKIAKLVNKDKNITLYTNSKYILGTIDVCIKHVLDFKKVSVTHYIENGKMVTLSHLKVDSNGIKDNPFALETDFAKNYIKDLLENHK